MSKTHEILSFFDRLLKEHPADRGRLVDSEMGQDDFLEEELSSFLEKVVVDSEQNQSLKDLLLQAAAAYGEANEEIPGQLGHYKVIRKLGEGGMGVVYLAYQALPFQRYVALKVMNLNIEAEAQNRFRFEYQILARLDHPSIARVFDAGVEILENRELPYFAMEYFPGIQITEFCRLHHLALPLRIQLFQDVCEGISHAHQRGLIHRDIKPNNILVCFVDRQPCVKIIDFGIAAMLPYQIGLDNEPEENLSRVLGTLLYMSQEQLAPGLGQLPDTRTDVYSLGIVLYEILVGHHPFSNSNLKMMNFSQKVEFLLNEPLPNPADQCKDKQIKRLLAGDLGKILTTATAKLPQDRYPSVSALRDDLCAFLENRPLSIGPQKITYRFSKFARRKRWTLGFLIASIATILGLLFFSLQAWQKSSQAEQRARRAVQEADNASVRHQVMHDFLRSMLASPNPKVQGRDVRVADILDIAGRRLAIDFSQQPEIQADLHVDLGESNLGLGRYPMALFHFDKAHQLRKVALGMNHPKTLRLLERKAFVLLSQKEIEAAEKQYREALALQTQLLGPKHEDLFLTKRGLANTLARLGRYQEAEAILEALEKEQLETQGLEHLETLLTMRAMANLWSRQNKLAEAEKRYSSIAESLIHLVGPYHPHTMSTLRSFATTLSLRGDYEAEERTRENLLGNLRIIMGEDHPETILEKHLLARSLYLQGKYGAADQLATEALDKAEKVLGKEQEDTLRILGDLALIKGKLGNHQEKTRLLQTNLDRCYNRYGPNHLLTLHAKVNLGEHYRQNARLNQAETVLRQAIESLKKVPGSQYLMVFARFNLAETLQDQKRFPLAAQLYRDCLDRMEDVFDIKSPYRAYFRIRYAMCLVGMDQFLEAEDALLELAEKIPDDGQFNEEMLEGLVALYGAWNRFPEMKLWQNRLAEWHASQLNQENSEKSLNQ